MKFVKKHKIKIIVLVVFVIVMLLATLGLKELLYPNTQKDIYGNRLDGIEKYDINQHKLDGIVSLIKEEESVSNASARLSGKVINIIITVKPEIDLITSKTIGDKLLEKFTTEEKGYFDIQLFINNSNAEDELYPIIGYKHHTSLSFKWTE